MIEPMTHGAPLESDWMLARAREYSTAFRGSMRALTALRPRICPFERLVEAVPERSKVLDIGCGTGLFLYLLLRAGRLEEGHGVDPNREAVNAGNGALRAFGFEQISLGKADGPNEWPQRRFDVVSMIDVVHHLPRDRQRALLTAACAAVRPGGLLIYKDMGSTPLWAAWANRLHDLVLAGQWIHYLPIVEVESGAIASGLQVVHRDAIRRGWYAHELRLLRRPESRPAPGIVKT